MNFFGVGPAELILILILLFVVAGPKRMIQWAYYLGRYTAQFRRMVEESWSQVRKELENAQIDLPEELPRRRVNLMQEANRAINAELNRAMPPTASKYSPRATNGAQPDAAEPNADSAPDSDRSDEPKRYDAWLPK
jgi:Sec-independent protein translocase protein TatA